MSRLNVEATAGPMPGDGCFILCMTGSMRAMECRIVGCIEASPTSCPAPYFQSDMKLRQNVVASYHTMANAYDRTGHVFAKVVNHV